MPNYSIEWRMTGMNLMRGTLALTRPCALDRQRPGLSERG